MLYFKLSRDFIFTEDIMGEQFNILLNQMLMFFTLIIIGFVAQKVKLLVNETIDGLSKLVVRLILPLMVFTTVVN